ncbi:hypothetical protein KR215_009504, partial [Drosophila sulfurigaster]
NIHQRIYGGKAAHTGQFPYIVSLVIGEGNKSFRCGGSIIDHNWILTAAHCTHNSDWVKIFYGSTKYEQGEFSHEVGSDNIIEHEHFDHDTGVNDIALIRTPRVEYSELVKKVSLADRDNDYEGSWAVASGWGQNESYILQDNLQFIDLQINSKMNCWNFIKKPSDTNICVGPNISLGDSGGPLVTRDDSKLVGLSSFIDSDLSGFTRVSAYLDWIRIGSDNIIQHEHFDHDTGVNDIALIRTPHVEYSELVNKVSVADLDNDFEGAWAVASGWGKNEYGIPQEDLLFVGLQIYSKKLWLEFVGELSDTIICGRNSDGVPTGEGDSGGPLVTRDDPKLIGVTSFAIEGYYTCFTRVSAYLNWIRDHIVL